MMSVELPSRDGSGYLLDMDDWSREIGQEMARRDGFKLEDAHWQQIEKAREFFSEHQTVPTIREFSKLVGVHKKEIFKLWSSGSMAPISRYGGLPQAQGFH